jgi:hypothetical protein
VSISKKTVSKGGILGEVNEFMWHPTSHSRVMSLLTILLLVSVLFMNIAAIKREERLTTIAASLESNISAISPAPTRISPISRDYSPTDVTTLRAQIISGNNISLKDKDSANLQTSSLVINSVPTEDYSYVEWVADFTLPNHPISELVLSYSGKYSATRTQSIYLYNYATSEWDKIDSRTVGESTSDIEITSIPNPSQYLSTKGQLQVKISSFSTVPFTTSNDYLKIGVK